MKPRESFCSLDECQPYTDGLGAGSKSSRPEVVLEVYTRRVLHFTTVVATRHPRALAKR